MRALGYLGLLAVVVIVCILAIRVYKAAVNVDAPDQPANSAAAQSAGVSQSEVNDEIRDTVRSANGK